MLKLYVWFTTRVKSLLVDNERGAAAVEYGLLVGLIAVAIIVAVYWLGSATHGVFCNVAQTLPFGPADCNAPIPAP
jgi:pilus assembly protein Flp/PilA